MKYEKEISTVFPVSMNLSRKKIADEIIRNVDELQTSLKSYFPSLSVDEYEWLINLFVICKTPNLTTIEKEQLINLRNDKFYRSTFFGKKLDEFWLSVKNLQSA